MAGGGLMDKLKSVLASPVQGLRGGERAPAFDPLVASCAILFEMAESDQEIAVEERRLIEHMLGEKFGLSAAEVQSLIAETERARAQATDLFPFTHAIAQQYTPEEKRTLLVMVWRVIFADGRLDPYEDQLAHRLQRMLAVNHSLLMEAKRLAREEGALAEG
jgi:uncharacterized tellurite resistance protein B-like protein